MSSHPEVGQERTIKLWFWQKEKEVGDWIYLLF